MVALDGDPAVGKVAPAVPGFPEFAAEHMVMLDEADTAGFPVMPVSGMPRGGDGGEDAGGAAADDEDVDMVGHRSTPVPFLEPIFPSRANIRT